MTTGTPVVLQVEQLTPQELAGLYGRTGSWFKKFVLRDLEPRTFVLLYSTAFFVFLLAWTASRGVLLGKSGVPWAFSLHGQTARPKQVRLPLFLDPVAMVVLLTTLSVPLCCSQQVAAVAVFNKMNEINMAARIVDVDVFAINHLVRGCNRAFRIIGSRWLSALIFGLASLNSYYFYQTIKKYGVLASWNRTALSDSSWSKLVYQGWWANDKQQPLFASVLVIVGAYLTYHVIKQLALGIVFAIYASAALRKGFGVSPNLMVNSDAFYGLRELRNFMQWTYAATTADFLMMLGILVVWLPFSELTVFVLLIVFTTNVITVLYPTSVALEGALLHKRCIVQSLTQSHAGSPPSAEVERVWGTPNLPFKVRGALSAATLYLLIPVVLAIVSGLLGGK